MDFDFNSTNNVIDRYKKYVKVFFQVDNNLTKLLLNNCTK